jgi:CheY-like chemotaxis protein
MKIEVRCPHCSVCYLLDQDAVDGELSCPGCATPISLPQTSLRPAAAPTPEQPAAALPAPGGAGRELPIAAAVPAAAPGGTAGAAAVATAAQPEAAPTPRAQEVVCPRCKLHFSPGRAAVAPEDEGQRYTVLVVEDLAYFQEIAREALSGSYEVITAATVTEARAALTAGGVDLMILDLTLDGGDHGVQLLRGMTSKPCPILIYTAQDESEMYGDSWEQLQELGADDIVIKGMNVGESLLQKVNALLGRSGEEEDPVTNTVTSR